MIVIMICMIFTFTVVVIFMIGKFVLLTFDMLIVFIMIIMIIMLIVFLVLIGTICPERNAIRSLNNHQIFIRQAVEHAVDPVLHTCTAVYKNISFFKICQIGGGWLPIMRFGTGWDEINQIDLIGTDF